MSEGGKGEKVVRVHEAFGRWEMMLHQRQTDKTANGTPKRRGLGRGLLGLFGATFRGIVWFLPNL